MKKTFIFILSSFLILPALSQSNVKQQLEKFLSSGCVKDGVIVSMQSTNPSLQFAIKQESSRTPGKFRYVFVDKRIGAFNENGKFEFSTSKMSCPQLSQNSSQSSSGTSNNSSSNSANNWHKCEWCGIKFTHSGFNIFYGNSETKIQSGGGYAHLSGNFCDKHFCSVKCANEKLRGF